MTNLKVASIPSVEKAMAILDHLSSSRKGCTLSELARVLRISKSSVHGIVATLERCGYLSRLDRRFLPSGNLMKMGKSGLYNLKIRESSMPELRALAEETMLTVNMAILEDDEVVFIEKITPSGVVSPPTWVGKHMDVNCTAVGKVLLAHLPQDQIDSFIFRNRVSKHNENAFVSANSLKEEVRKVRKLGYAVNDEENEIGYRAIAVPLFLNLCGNIAISLAGRTSEVSSQNLEKLAHRLQEAARRITERQGLLKSA